MVTVAISSQPPLSSLQRLPMVGKAEKSLRCVVVPLVRAELLHPKIRMENQSRWHGHRLAWSPPLRSGHQQRTAVLEFQTWRKLSKSSGKNHVSELKVNGRVC